MLRHRAHLSREATRKRCVARFRLRQSKVDIFASSDFEQFCKGNYSSTKSIGRNQGIIISLMKLSEHGMMKNGRTISREMFIVLYTKLKPSLKRRMVVREPLLVEKRVAITL